MIRVLGLALYGPLAASTRHRLGQYVQGLAAHGINLEIRHLLGDDYLRRRFAGQSASVSTLLRAGLQRLADLRQQAKFDLEMLHCELFPLLPGALESALLRPPYVYDFDDAFYLKYRTGRFAMLRPLLGSKFDRVMQGAAQITAGSSLLATYASRHNPNTRVLPTVVDTERYRPRVHHAGGRVFTVGWIGSPSTAGYLSQLIEPLSVLGAESAVRFVVVGGRCPAIPNVEVVELPWSEALEVDQLCGFDVGVMPLPDDEWARGKCAFKLIQYMACGVPVIASPVGANKDVVTEESGFLASDASEWVLALRHLRDKPSARRSLGAAGRQQVEERYSLAAALPVLAGVLRQTAKIG